MDVIENFEANLYANHLPPVEQRKNVCSDWECGCFVCLSKAVSIDLFWVSFFFPDLCRGYYLVSDNSWLIQK